jgi:hypothetical protein
MGKLGKDLPPLGKLRLLQHLRNYQMPCRVLQKKTNNAIKTAIGCKNQWRVTICGGTVKIRAVVQKMAASDQNLADQEGETRICAASACPFSRAASSGVPL